MEEGDAPPMQAERTTTDGPSGHPRLVVALLILATLLTLVAVFSVWVNRQALNTDNWVNTSDQLLQNKEIQAQLSSYLANELFADVDVQAELQKALPPRLAPLAGPAAGGLHQLAPQIAERALATSQVQSLWSEANRAAHESFLQILNGGGSSVSTNGGEVTLDLGSVVTQVGGRLGVGGNISAKVPPDAGQLTILKSSQLSAAQDIATLIRRLPVVLSLLAILLFGLAVYLAGPRRRQALRSVGFGFVVAGVIALVVRSVAGGYVVDSLATSASVEPAAQAAWNIGTSLLVTIASSAISFGILIVIGAWLAGPTRPAVALRREASPYVRDNRAAAYVSVGVLYVALIAWAPIVAFRKPIGMLLFAVLLGLGAELLRRQILREFPDAHGGQLWDRILHRGRSFSPGGGAAPAPAAGEGQSADTTAGSKVGELERLVSLHGSGALTDDEFASAKADVLGTPGPRG
jgi:hypothetical protein